MERQNETNQINEKTESAEPAIADIDEKKTVNNKRKKDRVRPVIKVNIINDYDFRD